MGWPTSVRGARILRAGRAVWEGLLRSRRAWTELPPPPPPPPPTPPPPPPRPYPSQRSPVQPRTTEFRYDRDWIMADRRRRALRRGQRRAAAATAVLGMAAARRSAFARKTAWFRKGGRRRRRSLRPSESAECESAHSPSRLTWRDFAGSCARSLLFPHSASAAKPKFCIPVATEQHASTHSSASRRS